MKNSKFNRSSFTVDLPKDSNARGDTRKNLLPGTHAAFWKLESEDTASSCVWKTNFNRAGSCGPKAIAARARL